MLRGMFVCSFCRNRFDIRPLDAQQDDICVRCLREQRVAAGVLPPAEPAPCDPDFVAFRDHIEHGPIPPWGFTADDFERARHTKWNAAQVLEDHPSDDNLRRFRTAERGLRRMFDYNAAKVAHRNPS
jgi:hypothetical protein